MDFRSSLLVFIHFSPYLIAFSALVGAIFGIIAIATQKSRRAGFSIFTWSFFGGLLGSIMGFLPAGFLAYQAVIQSNPTLRNPELSGLAQGMAAGTMVGVWLILLLLSSISGAMSGASFGLKFYHHRSRHR